MLVLYYSLISIFKERELCCPNSSLCSQFIYCVTFFIQFKKSGKEPKAGAELVCGNTTYKTKVGYKSEKQCGLFEISP